MHMNLNPQFRNCSTENVTEESVNLVVKVILGNCDTVCFFIKNKHGARFSGKWKHCHNWPCDICKQSTVLLLILQSLVDHIHGRSKCQISVPIREKSRCNAFVHGGQNHRSSKVSLQHHWHQWIRYLLWWRDMTAVTEFKTGLNREIYWAQCTGM